MHHESINDINNPADAAGPQQENSLAKLAQQLFSPFISGIYLYGFSCLQVIKFLLGNDDASATEALDTLLKEKLIKSIKTDQQQSGQVFKLTPAGADHAETDLGQVRGRKYDSTARLERPSRVRHDISSQLYAFRIRNRHAGIRYLPEAAMPVSKKTKLFDIVMMPKPGQLVGVEIERTSKYGEELKASMARTVRAIRSGDVDYVVFVLTTAEAVARYDRVLDDDSLVVYRKKGRRWIQDYVLDLTSDDLMRVVCVVGNPMIWKGAR